MTTLVKASPGNPCASIGVIEYAHNIFRITDDKNVHIRFIEDKITQIIHPVMFCRTSASGIETVDCSEGLKQIVPRLASLTNGAIFTFKNGTEIMFLDYFLALPTDKKLFLSQFGLYMPKFELHSASSTKDFKEERSIKV